MFQLFDDQIWQFVGVATTVILGVLGIVIPLKFSRKKIICRVVSSASLGTTAGQLIPITIGNQPVSDAFMIVLELRNAGNVEIDIGDYIHKQILFEFGKEASIINAEPLNTSPEVLKNFVNLDYHSKTVELNPLPLNSHDWIRFKVLLTGFKSEEDINVIAHIKGINKPISVHKSDRVLNKTVSWLIAIGSYLVLSLLFVISAAVCAYLFVTQNLDSRHILIIFVATMVITIAYINMFIIRLMRRFTR